MSYYSRNPVGSRPNHSNSRPGKLTAEIARGVAREAKSFGRTAGKEMRRFFNL